MYYLSALCHQLKVTVDVDDYELRGTVAASSHCRTSNNKWLQLNRFRLKKGTTTFGRHSKNDHYLDSSVLPHFISRWHSQIQMKDGKYYLEDSSLNGTYINDRRVCWHNCKTQ